MKLTLDVENTVTTRDGKLHLDPFETENELIMVGCLTDKQKKNICLECQQTHAHKKIQELLDACTILHWT